MPKMTIVKSSRVPGGFLLCQVWGCPGAWEWDENDEALSQPLQTDSDYPGAAMQWGWRPCDCGKTDGTVDCPHMTASDMSADACRFLEDGCLGTVVNDPGYFQQELPEGYNHVYA